MKIAIVGGGISSISLARLLKDDFEVECLERDSVAGGIARVREVGGRPYHVNGGHCFNSRYEDVMDFVFGEILAKEQWNFIAREAKVFFRGQWVDYPIEFSIHQLDKIDPDLAFKITTEMFGASYERGENLEEWFVNHFGPTLSREYFIPYNTKIWGIAPKNMSNVWIEDEKQMKLPVPTKESFFRGLMDRSKDKMVHTSFYYPKTNSINTFLDALGEGVECRLNYEVRSIEKEGSKWVINGERSYDLIINTSPLDRVPQILKNIPSEALNAFEKLKFNRVSNVLWETDGSLEMTWGYIPDPKIGFHRISNTGRVVQPHGNFCTQEAIGDIPYERLVEEGRKIAFLKRPLDYNVTEHAYVFFDLNYKEAKEKAVSYLHSIGLIPHGRFGEWEYYNMDVCIKRSIDLAQNLRAKFKA